MKPLKLALTTMLAVMTGCGGADLLSSNNRSGGLDGGLGGGYSGGGYSGYGNNGFNNNSSLNGRQSAGIRGRGTYPKVEFSFELADTQGNPFDYTENDIVATIGAPDGRNVKIPAFFDGGKTWRVRFTPDISGRHSITGISRNGKPIQPDKMEKRDLEATGTPEPGFVRRDSRDRLKFAFDNGNRYFPLGHNVPWTDAKAVELPGILEKMGKAGENWTRIWMTHWGGTSLDWSEGQKAPAAGFDLEAAKRVDQIMESAEKQGVYVQLVLQNHGQLSTSNDANWDRNPLNKKNGGFLTSPDEFFANPRAVAATRAKYRYILARWGYSTHVMAWELFNEVEGTDSWAHKHQDEIASWHSHMAEFLRQQDPNKHLITTSADISVPAVVQAMDFLQKHAYSADPLSGSRVETAKLDRPIFYGELGPQAVGEKNLAAWYREALWAGILGGASGSPGFWGWQTIDKENLYGLYQKAGEFLRQSGMNSRKGLQPAMVSVETSEPGPLNFSPGAGWASSKTTEFAIGSSGRVERLSELPSFLQGNAHREMFSSAAFKVKYPKAGTFAVHLNKVSKAGGKVVISVDGSAVAQKDLAGSDKDSAVDVMVEAKVPAGDHVVKIENPGQDWVHISGFRLDPYAPTLQAVGQSGKDFASLWILNRADAGTIGKIAISGMGKGTYKATWWDTAAGKALSEDSVTVADANPLSLTTPKVDRDIALYVTLANTKEASARQKSLPAEKRNTKKTTL